MNEKPLFSVIILHYNQPAYIKTAIDSVLRQRYENLELVIMDDCSPAGGFDDQGIKKYIEDNKGENIKSVKYQLNEQNLGTVKGINLALKQCKGEYILFFAADDALFEENAIENFYDAFTTAKDDVYMVTSQCYMMDTELKERIENFVTDDSFDNFEELDHISQFKMIAKRCCFAMGSTAMRRSMFDKFGYFNENYKFVEDWSYMLYLTRSGGKIAYRPFVGLLHRNGGVSHYKTKQLPKNLPPHVKAYRYDVLKIVEDEIFPSLEFFDRHQKEEILILYNFFKKDYAATEDGKPVMPFKSVFELFKIVYILNAIKSFVYYIEISKKPMLQVLKSVFLIWCGVSLIELTFVLVGAADMPISNALFYAAVCLLPCIFAALFAIYLISRLFPLSLRIWAAISSRLKKGAK